MKKFLSFVLALLLMLSLFSCGSASTGTETQSETESPADLEMLNNCDAAEITIDGVPLSDFSSDKIQYWYSVRRLRQAPEITATAISESATVAIDATRERAIITITSANQEKEKSYTVNFIDSATYDKYSLDLYTLPYWEGNVAYNETIMFVGEDAAPLLYYPDKVLSVRSYDLKTEYVEGVDYAVEDGKIVRLEGSRMPHLTEEEFYPSSAATSLAGVQACNVTGHPYILFSEGTFFFERQVHVTYSHTEEWAGFVPEESEKLHTFIERAEAGEELNLVFFGDSITTGGNASGRFGCAPGTEIWPVMVHKTLSERYPTAKINYINTAVGGKETNWAISTLKENVIDKNPDMLILAFGMNDGGKMPAEYETNIAKIVEEVLRVHPNCEIVLVSTMLPHSRLTSFYGNQRSFEPKLYSVAADYENVDVVPVTSVHKSILEHKRYYDMTGNNVNHPTDYLTRIYAQTVLKVLLG